MTAIRKMLTAFSFACTLVACSPSPDEQREAPPVKDTAFGDMVGTMDKARGVEATTMEHKEEIDRSLQEAEGGH